MFNFKYEVVTSILGYKVSLVRTETRGEAENQAILSMLHCAGSQIEIIDLVSSKVIETIDL